MLLLLLILALGRSVGRFVPWAFAVQTPSSSSSLSSRHHGGIASEAVPEGEEKEEEEEEKARLLTEIELRKDWRERLEEAIIGGP